MDAFQIGLDLRMAGEMVFIGLLAVAGAIIVSALLRGILNK